MLRSRLFSPFETFLFFIVLEVPVSYYDPLRVMGFFGDDVPLRQVVDL